MNRYQALLACIAVAGAQALSGCDSKAPGSDIVAKPSSGGSTSGVVPPDKGQADGSTSKPTPPKPPSVDIDRTKLPATLETDAYRYYGLASAEPVDMELKLTPDSGVLTGSVSYHMTKVDKGGTTFEMETTGALSDQLGNETLMLKPDGLYSVSSSLMKLSSPQLELPTGLTPGKTWKVDSVATSEKGKVRQQMTFTCKGPQDVKFGAKSYPTLHVVGVGTVSIGTQHSHVSMEEWFVKDVGTVKMKEIGQTSKGKPSVTFEMVWKPSDSKTKS